jgi:galactokinase/mevalonate kinase-like predicted kinase
MSNFFLTVAYDALWLRMTQEEFAEKYPDYKSLHQEIDDHIKKVILKYLRTKNIVFDGFYYDLVCPDHLIKVWTTSIYDDEVDMLHLMPILYFTNWEEAAKDDIKKQKEKEKKRRAESRKRRLREQEEERKLYEKLKQKYEPK